MMDLEKIAREAGIRFEFFMTNPPKPTGTALCQKESLEKFAALVLEEAARVAEDHVSYDWEARAVAAAIRALAKEDQ